MEVIQLLVAKTNEYYNQCFETLDNDGRTRDCTGDVHLLAIIIQLGHYVKEHTEILMVNSRIELYILQQHNKTRLGFSHTESCTF
jgi:hypothetical protein